MRNWIILFLLIIPPALAQEGNWLDPNNQDARIVFNSEKPGADKLPPNNVWEKVCKNIGQKLSTGPGRLGFLKSHSCGTGKTSQDKGQKKFWIIAISEKEKSFDIEISYFFSNKKYPVQRFNFQYEGQLLDALGKETVLASLARLILESLPTGWTMVYSGEKKPITFELEKNLPPPPDSLTVYRLSFNAEKNLWLPAFRGKLQRVDKENSGNEAKTASYNLSQSWLPLVAGETYWVQNHEGPNQRQKLYTEQLAKELSGFSILNLVDSLVFDSLTSNYAGIRLGKSFLQGNSILTRSYLLSILLEMRNGPLAGIRWYYDDMPRIESKSDTASEIFAMRRFSLGWAFDFEMPKAIEWITSRVDVQPKIGFLNLESKFSVLDAEGNAQQLDFNANRTMSLSLELGIENESSWFRSRLWTSYSTAKFGVSNKQDVSVYSAKSGLDLYFDLTQWGSLKSSALIFTNFENLSLTKNVEPSQETSASGINQIAFNLFFLGGGLVLTW
jgi:hypothetical protein